MRFNSNPPMRARPEAFRSTDQENDDAPAGTEVEGFGAMTDVGDCVAGAIAGTDGEGGGP